MFDQSVIIRNHNGIYVGMNRLKIEYTFTHLLSYDIIYMNKW